MRLLACLTALLSSSSAWAVSSKSDEWTFRVMLDDKPIGLHRFSVVTNGEQRLVTTEANFAVKFLGFAAYRYHHRAIEQWQGDCLWHLDATTNDDGTSSSVRSERNGGSLKVITERDTQVLSGCIMSFAYWNRALQSQSQLLNAQTGKVERVQIERIGTAKIDVHGQSKATDQVRITGPAAPIDVWYSAEGDWVGLDSVVAGGHRLSYRLP